MVLSSQVCGRVGGKREEQCFAYLAITSEGCSLSFCSWREPKGGAFMDETHQTSVYADPELQRRFVRAAINHWDVIHRILT